MFVERGIWVGRSWGGSGNRKEIEVRDMRLKVRVWWSFILRLGRDWECIFFCYFGGLGR